MVRGKNSILVLFLIVALSTLPARSQQSTPPQNPPVQPSPPVQPLPGATNDTSSNKTPPDANATPGANPAGAAAEDQPLTGAERFGNGAAPGGMRNYWIANAQFRELVDTNPTGSTTGRDLKSVSLLSGNFALNHLWSRSALTAAYAGGASFFNSVDNVNNNFHQLALTTKMAWRRWALLLSEQGSYLPESNFGFNGLGLTTGYGLGPGGLGGPFSTLNPIFDPNQSILTGRARRIGNTAVGEVDYSLSPRSTFVVTGSYGLLHYLDDGFIDNHAVMGRAGYDYQLTSKDTLGVNYGYTRFDFSGTSNVLQTHVAQLAYGRKITGRLGLQLYAGPEIIVFENVLNNPGPGVSWSAGANLGYHWERTGLSLTYLHGTSGGAGLFTGVRRDEVQAAVDRKFTRRLSATTNGGYARNSSLPQALVAPVLTPNSFKFDSWYAGALLNEKLARRISLFFSYSYLAQTSNNRACITGTCGTGFRRQQFGGGVNFTIGQRGIE
jgi:hypothetical protein